MKYIKKINVIIIILLLISLSFSNYSQASEIGNIFSDADNFLGAGEPIGSKIDEGQLKETSNFMYKLLLAIGIIVMFIVGTILGIQFMMASAEDKAKVKEALVPYIVGCVVIFGAFTIWSIAVNIGQDMQTDSSSSFIYSTVDGYWDWCMACDREITESEIQNMECNKCGKSKSRLATKIKRFYCGACGSELSQKEMDNEDCTECEFN